MAAIGFRPLTGMVPTSYEAKSVYELFSPPYGDGTMSRKLAGLALLFSPPYGDGTLWKTSC